MVGIEIPGHEATTVGIQHQRRCRRGRAAVQAQAQLLIARAADGTVFDLDAAGVDGRRAIGSQPIGAFPLGGKRLGPEFDDVQAGRGVTQCRVDAAQASAGVRDRSQSSCSLVSQRCPVTFI